jgi:Fic family protein
MIRSGTYKNQLNGEVKYSAFVPNPLPFELKKDPELDILLSEANLSLGRLDAISELVPDIDFLTLVFGRKEATFSSQVEGTQATFTDVFKAEAMVETKNIPSDVREILNYIKALNYGIDRLKDIPLSLRLIREIHKLLLKEVRGEEKMPGEFRKSQNWIGGPTIETATFIPPPPHEVMNCLGSLEKFLYDGKLIPPLIKTALIHAQFENIHPFLDGNGRTGRLLVTFYLWHQKILKRPILYLSVYFKKNQKNYYYRLSRFHKEDDIEGWLKFFFKGIIVTAKEELETAHKILDLKNRDIQKITEQLARISKNALVILNNLYKNPFISLKNVMSFTGLKSKSNAHHLLKKMEEVGILQVLPSKSSQTKTYVYKDYLDLLS